MPLRLLKSLELVVEFTEVLFAFVIVVLNREHDKIDVCSQHEKKLHILMPE